MIYSILKRSLDIASAATGLALLSPLLILICLLIAADSQGPVFYLQIRVGRALVPFRIFKFRTMVQNADRLGTAITRGGDPRVTRIGRWLRRYKIDELPQLINVLIGEMSLVGPRPEVAKYVALFKEDYDSILTIKPGITDYASIAFRNEGDMLTGVPDSELEYIRNILPRKIEYYKKYIRERNLRTDMKILLTTLKILGHHKDERSGDAGAGRP